MNSMTLPEPGATSPQPAARDHPAAARGLGALLIADALLSLAPVVVLGAALGWPASLGKPAAEQLAAIHANGDAVALGYGLYLLYSLLIAPVMIGLAARVFGGLNHPLPATVAAFAVLSALARAIGILRWLTVMPVLAAAHAAADPAARAQIELTFDAVTLYGGGIGEVLGVSLLMACAMAVLCVGALQRGGLPRALAASGVVVALALAGLSLPEFRGPDLVPVAAAVSALSAWMLAVGVWCLRRPKRG
jgi:Domain of unknown function (DUF4386)